jgi:hypothetical protein
MSMSNPNPDRRSNAPESEALGSDDVAIFENARQAVMSLKKTLDMWIVIGRAVMRARDIADRRGGRWAFQRLLEQQGIAPALGRTWATQKAQASKLINIIENLTAVTAWHEKLSATEQIQWAAPSTVYKHCPVFKNDSEEGDENNESSPRKKGIAELRAENAELRAKLARKADDGSLFDLKHDSADDIVAAIVANVSPPKAAAIGKGLLEGLKRKQQRPAG